MNLFKVTYGDQDLKSAIQKGQETFVVARSFLDAQELFTRNFVTAQIIAVVIVGCLFPTELIESTQD